MQLLSVANPEFPPPEAIFVLATAGVTYGIWKYVEAKRSPLNAIPTIGYSGALTSYITAIRWLFDGPNLLREGYAMYPNQPFKVAAMSRWVVVLSGEKHVEEMRRAPDEVLSLNEAVDETFQSKFVFGHILMHPHHITTVRSGITRNIVTKFDEIHDEILEGFKEYIPLSDDWVTVPTYETLMHIVCRAVNRFFVGAPLCRDPAYRTVQEMYTIDVMDGARTINLFPNFLKPLVGNYLTKVPKRKKEAMRHLQTMIEERKATIEQHGRDSPEVPNDLITWLLDTATHEYHCSANDIVLRILFLNFGAIHTTTTSLTQILYDLAVHPEYAEEMQQEALNAVTEHGWSKLAMAKMRKIDSFMKESLRMSPITSLSMSRKALKDWTMLDGTVIPAGTVVGIATDAMNRDETLFANPDLFQGFRFAEMREGEGELDGIKNQLASLSKDHVIFGHGRHACPGRFLAVNEMKVLFAHILINYDLQLENGSMDRPINSFKETNIIPNQKAKMMFRKQRKSI